MGAAIHRKMPRGAVITNGSAVRRRRLETNHRVGGEEKSEKLKNKRKSQ